MRSRVAVMAMALGVALATGVVALAASAKDGLPSYTDGYASWTKLNRRPLTAPGAHNGVKNVYASRSRGARRLFPNGTVIVKSIAESRGKGRAKQVAVMRKLEGRWQWVEYELNGGRYAVLARGALCSGCHMQARTNDWVFTRR